MLMRPPSSVFMACLKPTPSSPSRFSAGTRTSSRISSEVSLARMPSLFSCLPACSPFMPFSTMKALMPSVPCPGRVRAITTAIPPTVAWVMKFLRAVEDSSRRRPASPRCAARPRRCPASGSVSAQAPITLPLASGTQVRRFCASLPMAKMWFEQRLLCAAMLRPTLPSTRLSSSTTTAYSR